MVFKVGVIRLQLLAVILQAVSWCQAELFTAVSDLEPLLETHGEITDYVNIYIKIEEHKIQTLKRHLFLYKQEHHKAVEDIPNYLGNTNNVATLSNILAIDIDTIEDSIVAGTEYMKSRTKNLDTKKYPAMEDLTGAVQAIVRLQKIYRLNVTDLAEGILNGVVSSTPMTTDDCYVLGRALYRLKDIRNALAWKMEAYRKFHKEDQKDTLPISEINIVEHIEHYHYLLGDTKSSLKWSYKLLKLDPSHSRALSNIAHYEKLMKKNEADEKRRQLKHRDSEQDLPVQITKEEIKVRTTFHDHVLKNYEALCRGELDIAPDVSKRLKCWYSSDHHPFLKYAPFKVEQMYITPDIFIFHNVLYDDEIKVIQSTAKHMLTRAVVQDLKTGEKSSVPYRISKTSWLKDEEHPVIARISQRVGHMTGLDMDTANKLQVANYGIGGHYEPHLDFARNLKPTKSFSSGDGNRIATVLFYMSEVEQGGATVFTELGLTLTPIKGAAVFWMNMHPSCEDDLATRHGACPVLSGSKWICTKWIHQTGQELKKPCTLEYQKESIYRKILQPVPKKTWQFHPYSAPQTANHSTNYA